MGATRVSSIKVRVQIRGKTLRRPSNNQKISKRGQGNPKGIRKKNTIWRFQSYQNHFPNKSHDTEIRLGGFDSVM